MSPRWRLAVGAVVVAATAGGCGGEESARAPATPASDLAALCRELSTVADPPELTYDVAKGLVGQPLTICRTTLSPPASPAPPAVTEVSARLSERAGWAEAVSTDAPRPAGCVDSLSTRVFVWHEGEFLLARNCGISRPAVS